MHKQPVFLALSVLLASGASLASAYGATSEDMQRQILFESMMYGGVQAPDLQDKAPQRSPAAAPAARQPERRQRQEEARVTPPREAIAEEEDTAENTQEETGKIIASEEAWQDIAAPTEEVKQAALQPPAARPVRVTGMPAPSAPVAASGTMRVASVQSSAPPATMPAAAGTVMGRAQAGDPDAEYQMGMMYAQDRPGGRSTNAASQSYHWFTQAASKGHARAQYNLGVMYAQGDGIVQNLVEAYIWFNLAAAQRMEGALEARDMVAASLTPASLMKAQERSTLYYQQISDNRTRMAKEGPAAVVPVR